MKIFSWVYVLTSQEAVILETTTTGSKLVESLVDELFNSI